MNNTHGQSRPDPDQLLKSVVRKGGREKRGRLKVFFGMAAGVGKTYAMLESAHELVARGADVVVGWLDSHGRQETEALLSGLVTLPRRSVSYREVTLQEMDLDAILQRIPQVVLVDELAHSNVPGSRHAKRYLDVLEILDSGIDVLTTLNVQHLESRAETVREITGVPVRETVPDAVLDQADEIVLVDLAPDELLKRLKEGKVYLGEGAELAAHHFFREGNLTALREMALRVTAEHVDRDLRDYKQLHGIEDAWKSGTRLLVAVFASPFSEPLIRWTRRLASVMDATWLGVYVDTGALLSDEEKRLLARNLTLVQELNGEVVTTTDEDTVRGLLRVARQNNVTQIVVGKSRRSFWHRFRTRGSIIGRLLRESGNIDVYVVSSKDAKSDLPRPRLPRALSAWTRQDLIAVAMVLPALALVFRLMLPLIGYRAAGIFLLLTVILCGVRLSWWGVGAMALLSGLLWDYFFIPPHHTFYISAPEDVVMLVSYFVAAGVTGYLTSRLRRSQHALQIREERTAELYRLSRDLASSQSMEQVLSAAVRRLGAIFEARVLIWVAPEGQRGTEKVHFSEGWLFDEKEQSVASWVVANGKVAGRFTETLPAARALYIPLMTQQGALGVLGLDPEATAPISEDQLAFAETCARQIAAAVMREKLQEKARRTQSVEQAERLYQVLLDSVSHELKTPLATIHGSATDLVSEPTRSNPEAVAALGREIQQGTRRLQRLVNNLLDMTRLESGFSRLNLQPTDLRDLLGVALGRLDEELREHRLVLAIPDDLPLISCDFALIEQALANLLHNAASYTPAGSLIEVQARLEDPGVLLVVRDHGPGLPVQDTEQVFAKFYRGDPSRPGGTGLGLAIARGFVEAHGGTLKARNHPEGGAEFVLVLPRKWES
ncbi:MAG: sensor histidine kinase KdpD [Acidobacteriota bacterium]